MISENLGVPPCPCGGRGLSVCCGPLLLGERQADTAVELMRSRYTGFVVGAGEYLWRTWHPRTRPDTIEVDPDDDWTGLELLDVVEGGRNDAAGIVEFRAAHRGGVLHERSRFTRRAGRWFYVDGELFE